MTDEERAAHRKKLRQLIGSLEKDSDELNPQPHGRVQIDPHRLSELPYELRLGFTIDVLRGFDATLDIVAESEAPKAGTQQQAGKKQDEEGTQASTEAQNDE